MSTIKEEIGLRTVAPGVYTAQAPYEFTIGFTMFGGGVAAIIYNAAETHLRSDPKARELNQPDVIKMHIQFPRPCEAIESTLTVKPIKLGAIISTWQIELVQNDKLRCLALVTGGNFDNSTGPTMANGLRLQLQPPPPPKPDFERIKANKREENWISLVMTGDAIPITGRGLTVVPRKGCSTDSTADTWYRLFSDREAFHPTWLALMSDMMPSMSDMLLRNGGLYDGHNNITRALRFEAENPGVIPARLHSSLEVAMTSEIFNWTVTLDVEFTRRVPDGRDGLEWVCARTRADKCTDGRMYVENMLYDEEMELVCATRQLILVMEAARKFRPAKASL